MWQTNYASTVPKNLGVEGNFRLCSEGDFLTGRLCSLCFVILMYFLQICIPNLMTPQPKRKLKRLSLFIDWLLWWHNGDHFSYLVLLCFWNHPYVTSAKGLGGWVRKLSLFADFQYILYLFSHSGWLGQKKCTGKDRGVFRTFELRVLTIIDCPKIAGAKGQWQ